MTVADAIDRVLAAEQEAADAIRAAEAQAETLLRTARDTRRQMLDRARDRATRLHVRAQARLADTLTQLETQARATDDGGTPLAGLAAHAVERLALRLLAADDDVPA